MDTLKVQGWLNSGSLSFRKCYFKEADILVCKMAKTALSKQNSDLQETYMVESEFKYWTVHNQFF